jgi:hypothetical protein
VNVGLGAAVTAWAQIGDKFAVDGGDEIAGREAARVAADWLDLVDADRTIAGMPRS